ncbi:unnamed protein product [Vitrella brassicaformis CCMP3155]|uniref:Intimal thickness related receptor IRP domain-containing protein n=1 Tax=Vitrella brassicaformis (strain CCMP3155) TaxID=1169540 RepID=A0A0G4GLV5_VITBC|nr:unnamed protein product [Vitrella brassicaformis CCMP3155]|eukprot:CEM31107.1 unnamed protein product [Vitrella brassicaformis CCMP3155]
MDINSVDSSLYDDISQTSSITLWTTFGVLSALGLFMWVRAITATQKRAINSDNICMAVLLTGAFTYLGMSFGVGKELYADKTGDHYRVTLQLRYIGRLVGGALLGYAVSHLARATRYMQLVLMVLWGIIVTSLRYGLLVEWDGRWSFWGFALAVYVVYTYLLTFEIAQNVVDAEVQWTYNFLSTSTSVLIGFYFLFYVLGEIMQVVDVEVEIIVHCVMDFLLLGCLPTAITFLENSVDEGLLPSQEQEMNLYPGPHKVGFHPNPEYYEN